MAENVLLIGDDTDLLRVLGDNFQRIGYEVAGAATGEAGFEAFDRVRPDVVILDLHGPDVGGLDVLEQLKSRGGSVILLTGQGDSEIAVRAMQRGAEHCVPKPVDLNHLAAATARVCEKVSLMRQNTLLREALDRPLSAPPPGDVHELDPRKAGDRGTGGDRRHQPQALAEVERVHIEKTLRFHGGNRTRAALELGISRATLINKIKVYGLDV